MRIMVVVGTRPDALKMYPVWREVRRSGLEAIMVSTTQHSALLDQVFEELNFFPDYSLGVMVEQQQLSRLTGRLAFKLDEIMAEVSPGLVLVQGDTTSSLVGALVAYYHRIPVNHVEAGLRTGDPSRPFPEEVNRRMIAQLSDFHFAPTRKAMENLVAEGIDRNSIQISGNTAIDTLIETLERKPSIRDKRLEEVLNKEGDLITVTAHRRESFGEPLCELMGALIEITSRFSGVNIVYPVHPNPSVMEPVTRELGGRDRIHLIDPLGYGDLIQLLEASRLILTDSGGIQEEAPSLGKSVIVLRDKTERVETIESGVARLVGMDRARIVQAVIECLSENKRDGLAIPVENPYGDGIAARRIAGSILNRYLGVGEVPDEFSENTMPAVGDQDG